MKNRLGIIQMDSVPGDVSANLDKIERLVAGSVDAQTGLYLFCETGTTGYAVDAAKLAEPVPGPTTERLTALARAHDVYLAGGLIEQGADRPYNSAVVVGPEGVVACYRKVHLFGDENRSFAPGDRPVLVETPIGTVGVSICFDLMFPEYIRGLVLAGAQVVLNATYWFSVPATEPWGWSHHQTTAVAMTRALENNVFVGMACRTGHEGVLQGFGHSCIIGPSGKLLAGCGMEEGVIKADLNLGEIQAFAGMVHYLDCRRPSLYRMAPGF